MAPRLLPLLLLLPGYVLAQNANTDMDQTHFLRRHYDNQRWNFGIGAAGGSINFHQNGASGMNFYFTYNLIQSGRSSISLTQGLTFGSEDEYAISWPAIMIVAMVVGPYDPNLDLSDGHLIAAYADFPLLLHYNFGAGARRDTERSAEEKLGFYIGGGGTHTFTGYNNTFNKAAQTDFWALVADGGIRWKTSTNNVWCVGLEVEQPLRSPIGPIHNPIFFGINFSGLLKY